MTDFKNIQDIWQQQSETIGKDSDELLQKAKKMTKEMKHKHLWTQVILGITIVVIAGFFFYVTAWKDTKAAIALSLMAGVLLIRLILEMISLRRFKNIHVTTDVTDHNQRKLKFYSWRKKIHFVFTPIFLLVYTLSFLSMMPIFKQALSPGFYLYIQISGLFVLVGICFSIGSQIRKEIKILRFLRSINTLE
ncbi:hypothetical protein ACJD0Z_15395 [Flavobacteriaceae bacterium M23B6Z8]